MEAQERERVVCQQNGQGWERETCSESHREQKHTSAENTEGTKGSRV